MSGNSYGRGVVAKWSRDKFGRVFDFLPNNTFSRAFMEYSHDGIRNVHYGDVLIKFGAVLDCSKEVLPSLCPEVEKRVGSNFAQDGDLIVADTAEDDTVGKAVELQNVGETKIVSGLHTIFSRPRNKVFAPYWLGYFVNSDFFHRKLFRYIVGSKVSSIAKASLKNVDVLWPESEEQRKTVEILVACDEVIEKSERAKEKLRRIKDGLLADLMTRGIGNDGKIRPRPSKAPHLYKQSELGLIPKEWDVKLFDETFDMLGNNTFARAMMTNDKRSICNIHYGDVLIKYAESIDCSIENLPCLTAQAERRGTKDYLQDGDLVIADTAEDDTVGKAVEIQNVGALKVVAGLHTIPCRPKHDDFSPFWLGYFINSNVFHRQLFRYIVGSKVSSISRGSLKGLQIVIMQKSEQKKIADRLAAVDARIESEENAIAKYRKIKAGLMHRLLTPPSGAEIVDLAEGAT